MLIKRFRKLESFIVFFIFGAILNIILLLSANSFAGYLLKKCFTYSLQISQAGRHLCNLAPLLLFESIWIASRDLEHIMDFQFFLHNSKTYYPIFNFNTSIRRSLLVLYFIFLPKSSRKLMRALWLKNFISYSFWHITFFFTIKPETCLHHVIVLLKCYIFCSGC